MEILNNLSFGQFVSLSCAGIAMTFSNPFDLVRFRMQTMPQLVRQGSLKISYKGITDCMKRVLREEGFFAFWKGNLANLMRFYPSETINFTVKEVIQNQFLFRNSMWQAPLLLKNSISGLIGAWVSLLFLYPFDYSRLKQANDIAGKNGGIFRTLIKTIQMEGIRGIYRGALISFIGAGVFRSAYFGIFDSFKNQVNTNYQRLGIGYIATMAGIILTYPSDTVRRRMMMTSCQDYKYDGFFDCCRKIYKTEGITSYFRGGTIMFAQSFTGAAVLFMYDKVARDLRNLANNIE